MRYLVLVLACVLLAALALTAEAGRRRNKAEPVMVYFPPTATVDPSERYLVQIPGRTGWRTVYEVGQGECVRYDRKLVGDSIPYWLRACWKSAPTLCAEAVDDDGSHSLLDCSAIH